MKIKIALIQNEVNNFCSARQEFLSRALAKVLEIPAKQAQIHSRVPNLDFSSPSVSALLTDCKKIYRPGFMNNAIRLSVAAHPVSTHNRIMRALCFRPMLATERGAPLQSRPPSFLRFTFCDLLFIVFSSLAFLVVLKISTGAEHKKLVFWWVGNNAACYTLG